ncbi:putative ethanolamine-phosphate cytidylyltransferase [Leishmania major strain Friedlin]|uniref:Ethanolamine-phosphate cytidylyltransferase n=1 Tax=Leishmania major TaxID=5664 RepID=Q4Q5J3_LEIMA|nr:putative ethanolamine-phosphate cytidylyltransferase [Leishmania major strain Friedlin]CAG9580103.1 ethanolamine-phosphate_cytidylyltransferase [Leishmania major strain Friedlin]CAJ08605.1 putative ethanolamine-phosphate cytidylyltransferase [Leishmania major strain Friedlin]|eukprot:XP_001685405.1 putative ethanolamine-phosphate cytidylyltransferase [Leishmania major strain Friedlin]
MPTVSSSTPSPASTPTVGVPPGKVWLNADEPNDEYSLFCTEAIPPKVPGTVRIWVDGCFDMLHFGHANALRRARRLGDELFVGCHSDEEVMRFKGPPIMHAEERYEALRACKWVDHVVENYPYCTRLKDIERFEIDYVVHGDDISVDLNGRNSYQEIIDAGKFKVVKRTKGISTTDLVGRMLLCTKNHMLKSVDEVQLENSLLEHSPTMPCLTTSRKIVQFSNNSSPKPGDRIVYVDGSFDLFHIGHIRVLQKARELGDYVIAGVYEDQVVNEHKGKNYPIMSFNERVLGVLSCRYVDEVVMGVPFDVSKDVIDGLHINVVVGDKFSDLVVEEGGSTRYEVPKAMGIYHEVDSGCILSTDSLIDRVVENRLDFLKRQAEKRIKDTKSQEIKPDEYRKLREAS